MKKSINKILILILLMATSINVLGCGRKDEYSQYETLESYEYTARYNGNTYYELEIYGQERI